MLAQYVSTRRAPTRPFLPIVTPARNAHPLGAHTVRTEERPIGTACGQGLARLEGIYLLKEGERHGDKG